MPGRSGRRGDDRDNGQRGRSDGGAGRPGWPGEHRGGERAGIGGDLRRCRDGPGGGAMTAITASEAEVTAVLAGLDGRVSIAAVNGPASVVISGDAGTVRAAAEVFGARGRRTRPLRVSHAFHSA